VVLEDFLGQFLEYASRPVVDSSIWGHFDLDPDLNPADPDPADPVDPVEPVDPVDSDRVYWVDLLAA